MCSLLITIAYTLYDVFKLESPEYRIPKFNSSKLYTLSKL